MSTVLITRLNNVGERGSPCFTTLFTLNSDVYALFTFAFAVMFSRVSLTELINLGGILSWVEESNIKNINVIFIALFNNLPYHEDIFNCGSAGSESRLIVT